MDIEIQKETNFPLLSRKRVVCTMNAGGQTPSRLSLTRRLGTLLKTKEDLVSIRHVYTKYGNDRVKIIAHVYNDKKSKDLIEEKYLDEKLKKQVEKEKKADEEKKAADAAKKEAEATAAEEKKEDAAPAEEKKE